MATRNDLRREIRRAREWQMSDKDIAALLHITTDDLRELENPTPKSPPKPPRKALEAKQKAKRQNDPSSPIISRFVLFLAHYGGTFALAVFEILFFTSLAGDSVFMQWLLGITALVFTLGEVGLWEKGTWEKITKYKIVAVLMASFSFIGGAAVSLGEVAQYQKVSSIVDTSVLNDEYIGYTRRIEDIEEKLRALPETWITRINELNGEVERLTTERTKIREKIEAANVSVAEAGDSVEVFLLAANVLKVPVGTVALIFLLLRTLMLIVVTLSTSPHEGDKQ